MEIINTEHLNIQNKDWETALNRDAENETNEITIKLITTQETYLSVIRIYRMCNLEGRGES